MNKINLAFKLAEHIVNCMDQAIMYEYVLNELYDGYKDLPEQELIEIAELYPDLIEEITA
jgi:hypothetical protein